MNAVANMPGYAINLVAIAGILMPVLLIGTILTLSFRVRRYKTLHETLRIMAEKGVPIPPELLNPREFQSSQSVLRSGLVWLAIGIGAMIYLFIEGHNKWPLALIPSLVGIALLVSWAIENRKTGRP
jgi:hypothetical protein